MNDIYKSVFPFNKVLVLVATLTRKGHMWLKQKLQRSYEQQQQKIKMTLFIICLTFIENLRSSSLCDNEC